MDIASVYLYKIALQGFLERSRAVILFGFGDRIVGTALSLYQVEPPPLLHYSFFRFYPLSQAVTRKSWSADPGLIIKKEAVRWETTGLQKEEQKALF